MASVLWLVRKKPRRLTLAAQSVPASRGVKGQPAPPLQAWGRHMWVGVSLWDVSACDRCTFAVWSERGP